MSTVAKEKQGKTFEPVSEGLHPATCIQVLDLGEQYNKQYDKNQYKIMLTFESYDENIIVDGQEKPCVISKEYNLSLNEKATLRKDLEGWRGKKFTEAEVTGFDVKNVLGVPCQIQVLHATKGEKIYANINSIVPYPKGAEAPRPVNELIHYDMDDPERESALMLLPRWIQEKIKNSKTYLQTYSSMFEPIDPNDPDNPF